jgi:hypothetical protein
LHVRPKDQRIWGFDAQPGELLSKSTGNNYKQADILFAQNIHGVVILIILLIIAVSLFDTSNILCDFLIDLISVDWQDNE